MCKQCVTNSVYEFTNQRKLCARCFVGYFRRKFLYVIRRFAIIKSGDRVGYGNKGNFKEVVLEELLNLFSERANIELIKLPSEDRVDKIAVTSSLDSESNQIIRELVRGKNSKMKEFAPVHGRIIKPLYLFLDEEILLYAKIRKLKFKKEKITKDKFFIFIDELEKKHPEVKRAIVNSYLELFSF